MQHPSISGPSVSTEVGVEQLLSPGTVPGLDTQWWFMKSQAGYNLVEKLELKGQRPGGGYKMGMSAIEIRGYGYGEGQGLAQRPCVPHMSVRQAWP